MWACRKDGRWILHLWCSTSPRFTVCYRSCY